MTVCQQWKTVKNYKCNVANTGTTTQFVAAVLLQLKISRVYPEWTIYTLDSALSAYVLRPYSYR